MKPNELQLALHKLGINKTELASIVGRSRRSVTSWCNGTAPVPGAVHQLVFLWLNDNGLVNVSRRVAKEEAG